MDTWQNLMLPLVVVCCYRQVMSLAKSLDAPQASNTLSRDDSLMELERSFNTQMRAGAIPDTVAEVAETVPESPVDRPPSSVDFAPVTPSDAPPMRRRSIAVSVPTLSPVPGTSKRWEFFRPS